jgi:hypothetical protein
LVIWCFAGASAVAADAPPDFAKEDINPLSSTGVAGPILESSCAENPNGLFGAEGALPIPQTEKPDF